MSKTIKVSTYTRPDGVVVEEHNRTISEEEAKTLDSEIKRRKREQTQASILESFLGDK
jgi:hypothetical protein